jgi:predicted DNA binding CopG/RHH family protein
LSDLDFSQFKPVKFEFQAKAARLNMRLPVPLLDAVKASAKARGLHPVYPRGSGAGDSRETG